MIAASPARYNSFSELHQGETLSDLALPFTADELSGYVESRLIGLADTSCGWIRRSANTVEGHARGYLTHDDEAVTHRNAWALPKLAEP